jgi:hypothetical protein
MTNPRPGPAYLHRRRPIAERVADKRAEPQKYRRMVLVRDVREGRATVARVEWMRAER